ncbi:MAG TPA: virulence factor [Acidimicrobiia bacterium]
MSPRQTGPQLWVIRWREIPAQVLARHGEDSVKRELSARFQVAIDRAAMYAGLFGTDEYLSEWARDTRPCGEDLQSEADAEAERLEAAFDPDTLNDLAANGGAR